MSLLDDDLNPFSDAQVCVKHFQNYLGSLPFAVVFCYDFLGPISCVKWCNQFFSQQERSEEGSSKSLPEDNAAKRDVMDDIEIEKSEDGSTAKIDSVWMFFCFATELMWMWNNISEHENDA